MAGFSKSAASANSSSPCSSTDCSASRGSANARKSKKIRGLDKEERASSAPASGNASFTPGQTRPNLCAAQQANWCAHSSGNATSGNATNAAHASTAGSATDAGNATTYATDDAAITDNISACTTSGNAIYASSGNATNASTAGRATAFCGRLVRIWRLVRTAINSGSSKGST